MSWDFAESSLTQIRIIISRLSRSATYYYVLPPLRYLHFQMHPVCSEALIIIHYFRYGKGLKVVIFSYYSRK